MYLPTGVGFWVISIHFNFPYCGDVGQGQSDFILRGDYFCSELFSLELGITISAESHEYLKSLSHCIAFVLMLPL